MRYKPYKNTTMFVENGGVDTIFNFAVTDKQYHQLNQWTSNRYLILEVLRAIRIGYNDNPYKHKDFYNKTIINGFDMLADADKVAEDDYVRIAIRAGNASNTLHTFNIKRALHYINIFEDAMVIEHTTCATHIDEWDNIFFFTPDPIWLMSPFLFDLYLMLIELGDYVLMGNSPYTLLSDIEYLSQKEISPTLKFLQRQVKEVSELAHNFYLYVEDESFWQAPAGKKMYSETYNLYKLLTGKLMMGDRDKGIYNSMITTLKLLENDIPF